MSEKRILNWWFQYRFFRDEINIYENHRNYKIYLRQQFQVLKHYHRNASSLYALTKPPVHEHNLMIKIRILLDIIDDLLFP